MSKSKIQPKALQPDPVPAASPAGKAALSSRARKAIARRNAKKLRGGSDNAPTDARQISPDVHVYTDDSFKDKRKVVNTSGMKHVKERLAAINARFNLPEKISTARKMSPAFTKLPAFLQAIISFFRPTNTVLIINHDGKERAFLPDIPGDHRILCHGSIAKHLVSKVCMLVRITACADKDGMPIDGSWALVPAQYAMMRATTIQHLRRRPFFFLRRYWYEISFDGRVQPAHLLFDYNLDPEARSTRLYVTHEYIPVRKQDTTNDYFRFWHQVPAVSPAGEATVPTASAAGKNQVPAASAEGKTTNT